MGKRGFKVQLWLQIVIALVLGGMAGAWWGGVETWVGWIGTLFMNALSMLIVPVIFFSITISVRDICAKDPKDLKLLGGKSIGLYVLTMSIAIVTGIILVELIQPGSRVDIGLASADTADIQKYTILDIIVGFVPSNLVSALASNSTIPVIFISFLLGVALTKIPAERGRMWTELFRGGYDLTMTVMRWVLKFAPIGVFAIVAVQFSKVEDFGALIGNMLLYVVTVTAGLLFHTFVSLPIVMRVIGNVNPWKHLRNMANPIGMSFSTASSSATIPVSLEAVKHKDGVSDKVANFVIPLGATINMNGAALLECVAVIFIAQAYGVDLSVTDTILVSVMSLLCAVGSAGVPMSAMVMLTIILNVVGLPVEGIALVIGVDRILDMLRTAVNVYGDTCVAAIIAKTGGERLNV